MNVLWVVNTIFPEAADFIGVPRSVFGGWMYGLASALANTNCINLSIATVYEGNKFHAIKIGRVTYYLVPNGEGGAGDPSSWGRVSDMANPILVHVHGTEFEYGMVLMKERPELRYVVSIQGLVSVCWRYYLSGLGFWDVIANITIRDLIRRDTLFQARRKFYFRGLIEKEYIYKADAVIGRTDWDRSHVSAVRSDKVYFRCNEMLRDEFYCDDRWSLDACSRYSIFLSQAAYPLKGLHQVLKAVSLIKKEFPEIIIKVAGPDIVTNHTLKARLRRSGYAKYLSKLLVDFELQESVEFLGVLDAERMKNEYLKSNVFVCPSSVENSPNSLAEAQILGLPVVASYVGGIPSMTENRGVILYQFEEFEMLASILRKIFLEAELAINLGKTGRSFAQKRHAKQEIVSDLINIYNSINAFDKPAKCHGAIHAGY